MNSAARLQRYLFNRSRSISVTNTSRSIDPNQSASKIRGRLDRFMNAVCQRDDVVIASADDDSGVRGHGSMEADEVTAVECEQGSILSRREGEDFGIINTLMSHPCLLGGGQIVAKMT